MKVAREGQAPYSRSPIIRAPKAGAVMMEFALASLALYLLLAGIFSLGRWMSLTQSAQDAARVAAREMALYPLPPDFGFEDALADAGFRGAVYDTGSLVVDLDANPYGAALEGVFAAMPPVNKALRPLMIRSVVMVDGARRNLLHVPGAVTDLPGAPSGLTVVVPRVIGRDPATGAEVIDIVPFLEEISAGAFAFDSPERGLVGVRLHVPFQSAMLTAYLPGEGAPGFNQPVLAVDPDAGFHPILGPGPDGTGPYSGPHGLGEQQALGQVVRPFRRLITAQAVFRREVYQ